MLTVALALLLTALALGAFASLTFVWQWLIGAPGQLSASLLLIAIAAGSLKLLRFLRLRIPPTPVRTSGRWILFGLTIALAGFWMTQLALATPLGGWDGWNIWNLHARFLYRGGSSRWREVFDPALFWTQNTYPLLLPGLVSGFWTIVGTEHLIVPALVGSSFALLAVGIVGTATAAIAGEQRGWLAGLVLLATPGFLMQSSAQMADVPLSVYMLITVVMLQGAAAWPAVRVPLLALAGVSAGFAAWTKNEGLLFVVVVFVSHGISLAVRADWRRYRGHAMWIVAGLAPVLLLVLAFKQLLSPPDTIVLNVRAIEQMMHLERYQQIAAALVSRLMLFGDAIELGATHPGILIALCVVLFRPPLRGLGFTSLSLLLIPLLMLAGEVMVYLITPYDLSWHLRTSFDRLLLQLWPAAIFTLATIPGSAGDGTAALRAA